MALRPESAASARARHYTGRSLREVAFPLGGIGTGTVSLGGRGQLRDWEIFNRPAKGRDLPLCFFAVWARPEGGEPVARVLERRLLPPFVADRGLSPWAVAALPRLEEATFVGTYPTASVRFHDRVLPVAVELEAFTPFAPPDARVSGLPVAVFRWRLTNPSDRPVDVTLAYTQLNPVGYDGLEILRRGRRHPMFGGNVNQWTDEGPIRGLRMSRPGLDGGHPGAGTVAVATTWRDVTFAEHWERRRVVRRHPGVLGRLPCRRPPPGAGRGHAQPGWPDRRRHARPGGARPAGGDGGAARSSWPGTSRTWSTTGGPPRPCPARAWWVSG